MGWLSLCLPRPTSRGRARCGIFCKRHRRQSSGHHSQSEAAMQKEAYEDTNESELIDIGNAHSGCRMIIRKSEEHTSELQSLMRISYAVFCLKKKRIDVIKSYTTQKQ